MLIVTAADVFRAYPMKLAVETMKNAFAAFSGGKAEVPPRTHLHVAPHNGTTLVMSSFMEGADKSALAVKVVSLFPGNVKKGAPLIQAAVIALDPESGRPVALLEGAAVTAIRTGAASGAATDLLAAQTCSKAAVFGAGVQARTQLEAICTVRRLDTVFVYSPYPREVEKFMDDVAGKGPIPTDLRAASTPAEAVRDADIICTATTSRTPVFSHADIKAGVHINAVGSYCEDVSEIPAETVAEATVVVESRDAALEEAGELIQPIRRGLFSGDHVAAELGELVLGGKNIAHDPRKITLFKSVGIAVQDAASAAVILQQARKLQLGTAVEF